jgi:hypothetical protein
MKRHFFLSLFFCTTLLFCLKDIYSAEPGVFSGRLFKINEVGNFVSFVVDFQNMKFLNKQDRVQMWRQENPQVSCSGVLISKTSEVILLKLNDVQDCQKKIGLATGAYYRMNSFEFESRLDEVEDIYKILIDKEFALRSLILRNESDLSKFESRMKAVNERYKMLESKLKAEWKNDIRLIEEERGQLQKKIVDYQISRNDVLFKMEKYKKGDNNLKEDRSALDSRYFFTK